MPDEIFEGSRLETPSDASTLTASPGTVQVQLTARPGDRFGRYKILEEIGQGGCGAVFVAEQEEPVRRRVALKVIKLGMDTRQVIARFEAERQALAMMDHPNIAKVLDAGATDTGRPFFVMELVRGIKITEYCDRNKLSTSERLKLFIQVCHAVQHAHQKGIIHRDLKPSNILVTLHDGVPTPKVIDFGIAKATANQRLTDKTVYTAFEQFIGTPAYMSPEQAEMSGLDIDTRSDVYSLGVLLYELLVGETPFSSEELLGVGLDAMRRILREKDPARPSTKLSTMTDADLTAIAQHRQSEVPRLIHSVRGDLDWIVMKCLEKDRTRRYETANGLAMDIQRHLHSEPVVARPPSQLYRLQKLARRNRTAFGAVTAILTALLIGLTVSVWQAIRATRAQRSEAKARLAADEFRARESQQRRLAEDGARRATESARDTQRLLYAADMKLAQVAWEEGNLSRMISILEAHRPKPEQPDARGFEYYYLQELARGEQQQILGGHTNSVQHVVVSADGKWLASRGQCDTRLWDLTRRSLTAAWPSARVGYWDSPVDPSISFSYDSRYLAFPSGEGLEIYDTVTHQTRRFQSGGIDKPLFSPVTNLIAFDSEGKIKVWDYVANKEVGVVGPNLEIWLWAPDGSRLLAANGNGMGMSSKMGWWDVPSFKVVETVQAEAPISGTAESQDGRLTAAADWQGAIWLVNFPGGKLLGKLDCGDIRTSALAFSPDGKFLATSSRDQAILIWSVESRQPVRQLRGHHAKVTSLAYTPDGQLLVSGDQDGKLLLWNMAGETPRLQIANRMGSFGYNPPQFSADGKLLAMVMTETDGGRICDKYCILDTSNFQSQASIQGSFVGFSLDAGQVAFIPAGARQLVLRLAKVGAPSHRATIPLDIPGLEHARPELSPDGRFLLVTAVNGQAFVLDAATGQRMLSVPGDRPFGSRFLPDGRSLICAAGSVLAVWDIHSKQKLRSVDCGSPVLSLAVSPDGRFAAAGCEDFRIALCDLISGEPPTILNGHQAFVFALCFSPDGRTLASGSEDRSLKLWNLPARRETASFVQEKPVYWLAFSPDNQMLVSGSLGSYQVWRAPRSELLASSSSAQQPVTNPPAGSVWQTPDGDAPVAPQTLTVKNHCVTNLLKIHAAIMAYQKDHQQMPDWLGDLVPKYLPDTNNLVCPLLSTEKAPHSRLPMDDPKVTTSYSYEFSAQPYRFTDIFDLAAPGDTMKTWKTKQLEQYGGIVPVVRCAEHSAVLNVSYAGEISETISLWENAADVRWRAKDSAAAELWYRKVEQEGNIETLKLHAWRWATSGIPEERDGRAAVRFAERGVEITKRRNADLINTLAAAYAELGQFDKAVSLELEAISLVNADPSERKAEVQGYEALVDQYRRHEPLRE